MKSIFTICLFIVASSAYSQSIDSVDSKNGYKDVSLGISLDSLKKITKVRTGLLKFETNEKLYHWATEKKYQSFSTFKVACAVGIYKKENIVSDVMLLVDSPSRSKYEALVKFFTVLYGQPNKKDKLGDLTAWKGSKVKMAVWYDWVNSNLLIMIINIDIEERIEADKEARLKKEVKEF